MKNLYSFVQGLLEWQFSELFSANVSLWNQYQYIAFNIFSCRIVIILYKILIISGTSNEKTSELTINGILCRNVAIFYRQKLASLFQVQEKLKACRSSKLNFANSSFVADDRHVKIAWLHIVLPANMIFFIFEIMSICLNIFQWNYLKIALIFSITKIKSVYKFSNLCTR